MNITDKKKAASQGPPFSLNDIITIDIESLASGGAGVSRYNNFVVFTPFACPGDKVSARITQIHKNFSEAEVIEILTPSPERVSPQCPVFGTCGGCNWQHVSHQEQLKQKRIIAQTALQKNASLTSFYVQETIASPKNFRYRNRIQIKIDNQGHWGYYRRKSHEIVAIKDCPISDEKLWQDLPGKLSSKNMCINTEKEEHQKIEISLSQKGLVNISNLNDTNSSEQGFSQVNESVNQLLTKDIIANLKKILQPQDTLYDLYCGYGNFSFPIKEQLSPFEIIGVESSPASIQIALNKTSTENIKKTYFICQDVKKFLHRCSNLNGPVLLDPPRTGCDKDVIHLLANLKPTFIIYVSCNPQTLARDLGRLIDKEPRYKIQLIQPYDMFPQTDHVEVMTLLSLETLSTRV